MKNYRGFIYPTLNEALDFYNVDGKVGGFSNYEKECPNLLIRLPKSGVTLSIDGVSREDLFMMRHNGSIPKDVAKEVESKIDDVCCRYFDSVMAGDIDI